MKAIVISEFGGVDKLHFEEVPTPSPAENEVLIKIAYTSVNPVDWKIREGTLKNYLKYEFPIILGWDAAGTIAALGENVTNIKIGDEVFAYCRKPIVKNGTYAEFIAFPAEHVALKPKNINFAQAAGIPLVALTAWQSLFEHAKIKKGQTILIQAGAGGVGSLAIELAKYAGAKIYTTAGIENHAYVRKLGADVALDYHRENFLEKIMQQEPQGLDVVLDCVGGSALQDSYPLLKQGGYIVSIVEPINHDLVAKQMAKGSYCFVAPNGAQLTQIAHLLSEGKIQAPYIHEMALDQVAKAHEMNRQGHTRGKIVLRVSS